MSGSSPRVSIGLPVYNGRNFIAETLESLLAQTFTDFEVIISDNASQDSTEEICCNYAAKDQRVVYHRNDRNLGASANYNLVFEKSSGEYFKWVAHDDICAPDYLRRCVEVLDGEPNVVLCFPKTTYIDAQGRVLEANRGTYSIRHDKLVDRLRDLIRYEIKSDEVFWSVFGLTRARALKRTRLIAPFIASDQLLLMELVLLGEFYEVPEHLYFRRVHPLASTGNFRTYHQQAAWWDSTRTAKVVLPFWKLWFEHLASLRAVELSLSETAVAYYLIAKRFVWRWRTLRRELVSVIAQMLKRDVF